MFYFFIQMFIAVLFKAVQIENNPNIHQVENRVFIQWNSYKNTKTPHIILISGHNRGESLKNYIKWGSQMEQMILFMWLRKNANRGSGRQTNRGEVGVFLYIYSFFSLDHMLHPNVSIVFRTGRCVTLNQGNRAILWWSWFLKPRKISNLDRPEAMLMESPETRPDWIIVYVTKFINSDLFLR